MLEVSAYHKVPWPARFLCALKHRASVTWVGLLDYTVLISLVIKNEKKCVNLDKEVSTIGCWVVRLAKEHWLGHISNLV